MKVINDIWRVKTIGILETDSKNRLLNVWDILKNSKDSEGNVLSLDKPTDGQKLLNLQNSLVPTQPNILKYWFGYLYKNRSLV